MPNRPAKRNDPFKGIKSGGWTKHSGARFGLIRSQEDVGWACQACGAEQPIGLPGFFLELFPKAREYAKVCSKCFRLARLNGYNYRRVTIIVRIPEALEIP